MLTVVLFFICLLFQYNAVMKVEAKGDMPGRTLTPIQLGIDLLVIYCMQTKCNRASETSHENKHELQC